MPSAFQPIGEQLFLNVAIPLTRLPVAEVGIPQYLLEECEDTCLCACFSVANGTHHSGCQFGLLRNPCQLSVVGKKVR